MKVHSPGNMRTGNLQVWPSSSVASEKVRSSQSVHVPRKCAQKRALMLQNSFEE